MIRFLRRWWHWTLQGLKLGLWFIVPSILVQILLGISAVFMSVPEDYGMEPIWAKALSVIGIVPLLFIPSVFAIMFYLQYQENPLRPWEEKTKQEVKTSPAPSPDNAPS